VMLKQNRKFKELPKRSCSLFLGSSRTSSLPHFYLIIISKKNLMTCSGYPAPAGLK
jgi:hypothetical protein